MSRSGKSENGEEARCDHVNLSEYRPIRDLYAFGDIELGRRVIVSMYNRLKLRSTGGEVGQYRDEEISLIYNVWAKRIKKCDGHSRNTGIASGGKWDDAARNREGTGDSCSRKGMSKLPKREVP